MTTVNEFQHFLMLDESPAIGDGHTLFHFLQKPIVVIDGAFHHFTHERFRVAPLFRTGWFVESLATQTLVVFVIRTAGNPLKSRPSGRLLVGVLEHRPPQYRKASQGTAVVEYNRLLGWPVPLKIYFRPHPKKSFTEGDCFPTKSHLKNRSVESPTMTSNQIQHIFVLMLENRAFDHMLGFSDITGTDSETSGPTALIGLSGHETNSWDGKVGKVSELADDVMVVDPGHEFADVLCQLSGSAATYTPGATYPPIDNSGFMASYAHTCAKANQHRDPAEILKCFSPAHLPVLNALAREFAICDNWHSPMPGPTWPNRMFVHGASSGGLDHSPTVAEIAVWELTGFTFPNGDIFDRIAAKGLNRRLYAGDLFPMMGALKGIRLDDIRQFEHFAADLQGDFNYNYVFIEPSYNLTQDYRGSTSQHPLGDVRLGEGLIKSTYEAIRNSSVWPNSLLIVTWDEHGGFFDHVIPPAAVAPGDTAPGTGHNKFGFTFEQYGPRVPALVISPLVPKNTIDHRLYDHASIPATIEQLFGLAALTDRDRAANSVLPLLSLDAARNTPTSLPSPASPLPMPAAAAQAMPLAAGSVIVRPHDSVNDGNLPVVIQAAMHQDMELSPPGERANILARVAGLKTRADAANYLLDVASKHPATTVRAAG